MLCKLDLLLPPSSLTVKTEILPPWPGCLPTLEVKPQSKLPANPVASKAPTKGHLFCSATPETATKTSLLPSLPLCMWHISSSLYSSYTCLVSISFAPGPVLGFGGYLAQELALGLRPCE